MPTRLDMLRAFLVQHPHDPFPRYGLAMEHKNVGNLEEASREFDVLMSAHPSYTAAYLHAGNTLVALGRADEARGVYERGLEVCRERGDTHAAGELETALSSL